jgi:hypothetical protein
MLRAAFLAAMIAACYGDADVGYRATYTAETPTLTYVEPGVQVVADYDQPVFYSGGAYWRWDSGRWYRSPYYNRGWSITGDVPVQVRGIHEPWAYRHYRARGHVVTRDHRRY